MNDVLNGVISLVVGGLEWCLGLVFGVGSVMKEAVGEGTADALVEEEEQESNSDALVSQPIGVAVPSRWTRAWAFILRKS
jgi:hypothetical protein